ncbi:MAG TPA: ferritin-like domain-containing protein [Chitinophagaceae bacterium]
MPRTASKKTTSSSKSTSRSASQGNTSRSNGATRSGATARGGRSGSASPTSRNRGAAKEVERGSMLHEFFMDTLKDIYWAEKAQLKAMQKMRKQSTTEDLVDAFEQHRMQTETHVERLEQIFEMMGKKAQAKKCEAMAGLIEEANNVMEETADDTYTRDCALIVSAQKAEHYEIASYGSLVILARAMGHSEAAELLQETLDEEKETDQLLTQIAESYINEEALSEGSGEEESEEEEE